MKSKDMENLDDILANLYMAAKQCFQAKNYKLAVKASKVYGELLTVKLIEEAEQRRIENNENS